MLERFELDQTQPFIIQWGMKIRVFLFNAMWLWVNPISLNGSLFFSRLSYYFSFIYLFVFLTTDYRLPSVCNTSTRKFEYRLILVLKVCAQLCGYSYAYNFSIVPISFTEFQNGHIRELRRFTRSFEIL